MKVIGTKPDGSISAEPDSQDGMIRIGLRNAKQIAVEHGQVVHFVWNDVPIAVASDTDLDLIMRQWESRKPGAPLVEIGPYPDPATTPEYTHGVHQVTIGQ